MSWDPYLEMLTSAGFHQCCIAGHNGQLWGTTPGFQPVAYEIKCFTSIFEHEEKAVKKLHEKGFSVQGLPYAMNRLEEVDDELGYLIGRCKEQGSDSLGAIIARTAKTIIVGVHNPVLANDFSFGKGRVAISQLAEALAGMNF